MKKRILIVYPSPLLGGSSTSLLAFIKSLNKDAFDVTLLFFSEKGPLNKDFLSLDNVTIRSLNDEKIIHKKKISSPVCWIAKIYSVLLGNINKQANFSNEIMSYFNNKYRKNLAEPYDIAISYLESDAAIYVSKHVRAKKKIAWIHVNYSEAGYSPKYDKRMYSTFDTIVTVSESCRISFVKAFPDLIQKTIVINNLLSPSVCKTRMQEKTPFPFWPNVDKINLVSTCRIEKYQKGIDRTIAAIAEAKKRDTTFCLNFYFIGDGPDLDEMEAKVKELGIQRDVFFLGRQNNPLAFYQKMDLFFLFSRYEGRPMAVDEALLCGLPCSITDYSSARVQIDDKTSGFILENSFESIVSFLASLSKRKKELKKMKSNVCAVSRYNNAASIAEIEDLL